VKPPLGRLSNGERVSSEAMNRSFFYFRMKVEGLRGWNKDRKSINIKHRRTVSLKSSSSPPI
jgi:hypothetical protein